MISNTTIRINDKVKMAAKSKIESQFIRGGFSAYVEALIKADLDKDKINYKK